MTGVGVPTEILAAIWLWGDMAILSPAFLVAFPSGQLMRTVRSLYLILIAYQRETRPRARFCHKSRTSQAPSLSAGQGWPGLGWPACPGGLMGWRCEGQGTLCYRTFFRVLPIALLVPFGAGVALDRRPQTHHAGAAQSSAFSSENPTSKTSAALASLASLGGIIFPGGVGPIPCTFSPSLGRTELVVP